MVQIAMMTFLERLRRFPEVLSESDLRARLFQITKWKIADPLKNPRRERREGSMEQGFDPVAGRSSRGSVTRADDRRHLRELIGRLRESYATVLQHCVLEDRSIAETASLLELSEENVRKRLLRARNELAELTSEWARRERGQAR